MMTNPPCAVCGKEVNFPDAQLCNRCWELEYRIDRPEDCAIAASVLEKKGYTVAKAAEWSTDFPKEAGTYWFYGWAFNVHDFHGKVDKPELVTAEVHWAGKGKGRFLMYIAKGAFLYPGKETIGKWLPLKPPTLPNLSDIKPEDKEKR